MPGGIHERPSEEQLLDQSLSTFCSNLAAQHHLQFLCTGSFKDRGPRSYFGAIYHGHDALTFEEARKLTRSLLEKYLAYLQTAPEIRKFQLWRRENKQGVSDMPPRTDAVLKITFWIEEKSPQKPPYIAQITFFDDVFSFYQADPVTHELTCVHKEPYEAIMGA